MILIAAGMIMFTAVQRFLDPQPLQDVGIGLAVSVAASALNGTVAWILMRVLKRG
jgi:Co/Zn/Cd efflux system component